MNFALYLHQLRFIAPELILTGCACIAILLHVFFHKNGQRYAGIASLFSLVIGLWALQFSPRGETIFNGSLVIDSFSMYLKMIILLAAILSMILALRFFEREGEEAGETYYLLVFAVIGMLFTVSANDFITFYVAFELFAITSYILAGIFKKDRRSAEAGLKYFILGVLSSAIMLLGMAVIYGLTGKTNFGDIAAHLTSAPHPIAVIGMILLFVGLFFKVALVPFHMWTPDVYEGAPTPLVAFLSTAPKAAVFGIMMRLITVVFPHLASKWQLWFGIIAVLTMFWGNLAALKQTNIKRMMAYSTIAHAGYLMIGLAAWGASGNMAVLFYLFPYVFMNIAVFALIILVQKQNGCGENLEDLNGLATKAPLAAAGIIILLLSLTGIPPTAGFIGKYYLFAAAIGKGLYYLAIAGALNSVISLFYYFRIGRAMFMEPVNPATTVDRALFANIVLLVCVIVILLLGILPGRLTDFVSFVTLQ